MNISKRKFLKPVAFVAATLASSSAIAIPETNSSSVVSTSYVATYNIDSNGADLNPFIIAPSQSQTEMAYHSSHSSHNSHSSHSSHSSHYSSSY